MMGEKRLTMDGKRGTEMIEDLYIRCGKLPERSIRKRTLNQTDRRLNQTGNNPFSICLYLCCMKFILGNTRSAYED